MPNVEVFCERCGTRQPVPQQASGKSAALGRFMYKVGLQSLPPAATEVEFLRLCLSCRGYSCPNCWNEEVGLCQTCVPLPEPPYVEPEAIAPVFASDVFEPPPAPEYAPTVDFAPAAEYQSKADFQPTALSPAAIAFAQPQPIESAFDAPAPAFEANGEDPVPLIWDEPEPVVLAEPEPEPEPVVVAEVEPEPVVVTEPPTVPQPESRPEPVPFVPPLGLPPARPLPPPPPPPRIEFDVPPPPAFMIPRTQPPAAAQAAVPMPQVPAGLFEQPTPAIRPCHKCDLPLSAKARFCRRCGTAQA